MDKREQINIHEYLAEFDHIPGTRVISVDRASKRGRKGPRFVRLDWVVGARAGFLEAADRRGGRLCTFFAVTFPLMKLSGKIEKAIQAKGFKNDQG